MARKALQGVKEAFDEVALSPKDIGAPSPPPEAGATPRRRRAEEGRRRRGCAPRASKRGVTCRRTSLCRPDRRAAPAISRSANQNADAARRSSAGAGQGVTGVEPRAAVATPGGRRGRRPVFQKFLACGDFAAASFACSARRAATAMLSGLSATRAEVPAALSRVFRESRQKSLSRVGEVCGLRALHGRDRRGHERAPGGRESQRTRPCSRPWRPS